MTEEYSRLITNAVAVRIYLRKLIAQNKGEGPPQIALEDVAVSLADGYRMEKTGEMEYRCCTRWSEHPGVAIEERESAAYASICKCDIF